MREKLIPNICGYYGLGRLQSFETAGGYANSNWKVCTDIGQYLVKFVVEHSLNELTTEIEFLNYISSTEFPCVRFLENQSGEQIFREGGHVVVVLPYLSGKVDQEISLDGLSSLAQAIANLHCLDYQPMRPRNTWWRANYLENGLALVKEKVHDIELSNLENRILKLGDINTWELPRSLIHGDPWPENALFENGKLQALIDWEEVSIGFPIFDLAWLGLNTCFPNGKFSQSMFRCLMESYESIRALSASERGYFNQAVQRVACTAYLWLLIKSMGEAEQPGDLEFSEWLFKRDLGQLKLHDIH